MPSMIFILFLSAFYQMRKDFTLAYRTYSFFIIYWLQFCTLLKLLHDVIVKVAPHHRRPLLRAPPQGREVSRRRGAQRAVAWVV